MFHKIKSAAPLPGATLLIHFACGVTKTYPLSQAVSRCPQLQRLLDDEPLFAQVAVDLGGYGVSWGDELDLACEELWANGLDAASPFDDLLALSDATELWQLNESTLRKAVSYRKLVEGVDIQKFGKQWVVTRAAMEREYGPIRQKA